MGKPKVPKLLRKGRLAFLEQRQRAKRRGIGWELTFEEWWFTWVVSGRWSKRGTRRGCYVMARDNDTGPYAMGNVSIQLASANAHDGNTREARIRQAKLKGEILLPFKRTHETESLQIAL